MNRGLYCDLSNTPFNFKFAKEFHFDVEHDFPSYMCDIVTIQVTSIHI